MLDHPPAPSTPAAPSSSETDIAVVGMAGRFPGARDVESFWRNLREGRSAISVFSDEALRAARVPPAESGRPEYVRARGIIDGPEFFDAAFFGFTPREAEVIDPQQRLLLECAWEALETAGQDPARFPGRIGVFAGTATSSYLFKNLFPNRELLERLGIAMVFQGNLVDQVATRISYKLDLRGPSVTVQTACSTSLVAVHMALQSLLSGECDLAVAGGASITVPQESGYLYVAGGICSPSGTCLPFEARAEGTVFSNGVGVVVLRRLADALAAGDPIRAVIKGSAINNDGASKVGYTAPSVDGQAEVIADALAVGQVPPESITFIETHGTGTALGDPIELEALRRAFADGIAAEGCALGALKGAVGHLDVAAGVAGFIRTCLALEHQEIPPAAYFQTPHPAVALAEGSFYLPSQLRPWPRTAFPRRAGVSAFGVGGTNAHVVLEEAPARPVTQEPKRRELLLVSARTAGALEQAASRLAARLRAEPSLPLGDVAWTLQSGRRAFEQRLFVIGEEADTCARALDSAGERRMASSVEGGARVAFLFPGQGTQSVGMMRRLYEEAPVFRHELERCAEILRPLLDGDVLRLLYPTEPQERAATRLLETDVGQPVLFMVEYALARLWQSWGVRPEALLGHSVGEYVAACLSGVLPLESALRLLVVRGRLLQSLDVGVMAAVRLSERELAPFLGSEVGLAAVNGARQCVVSGRREALEELERTWARQGIASMRLPVNRAFHSPMCDPILASFRAEVAKVSFGEPAIPYVSNVTGTWVTAEQAREPETWVAHLRGTVRFSDGLQRLLGGEPPPGALLEIGPGSTLTEFARVQVSRQLGPRVSCLSSDPEGKGGEDLLETLGGLWLAGVELDWEAVRGGRSRRKVVLPTYPFDRQRCWIEPPAEPVAGEAATPSGGSPRASLDEWFHVPTWHRVEAAGAPLAGPRWLIFADDAGIAERLAQRLRRKAHTVSLVRPGEAFAEPERGEYRVHGARREDYDELFTHLRAVGRLPDAVLHAWSLGPDEGAGAPQGSEVLERGLHSLVSLFQALSKQHVVHPVSVFTLTTSIHDVLGEERLNPWKATLLAPTLVAPQEYRNLTCRNIDIGPMPDGNLDALAERLLAEFVTSASAPVVAYRGKHRWARAFERVALARPEPLPLREGGVYVVSGGLGGIGLVLARAIAQRARGSRLALLSRSPLPARSEWRTLIDSPHGDERMKARLREVLAIEALGAQVLPLQVDVTRAEEISAAFREIREAFGAVHGVIHAAGVPGGAAIEVRTRAAGEQILAPKLMGTLHLIREAGDSVDFVHLCSSISAVVGGFGQVDYCAANAFLDAFAQQQRIQMGRPFTSVNWDTWREVGMALAAQLPEHHAALRGQVLEKAISPGEGVEVFERLLAGARAQVVVATHSLERSGETLTEAAARPVAAIHPRPELDVPYVAPRNETEQRIAELFEELVGIERVGVNDSFFALGGDSLLAAQALSRLRRAFQADLPLSLLFESPSVATLAVAIEEFLLAEIEEMP